MAGTRLSSYPGWKLITTLIIIGLILPVVFVLGNSFSVNFTNWISSTVLLPLYLRNTSILLIGVASIALATGISTAWFVTVYEFPFRKHFEWMLILPLSIPTFINAIAYSGLTDYAGPIRIFLRWIDADVYLDIMNHEGAIFVMGIVLYPYVYVASRAAFVLQSASLIEVSRSLGQTMSRTFFRVTMPIAWPAVFSGLILVIMEVLNDYGVVQYYGIPTFTIGIFKSWLALGDLPSAIFLSLFILIFILILVLSDTFIQRKKRLSNEKEDRIFARIISKRKWFLFTLCFLPLLLGFIIPVAQMIWWAILASDFEAWAGALSFMGNTSLLAGMAGMAVVLFSIIISYTSRLSAQNWLTVSFFKLPMFGYAIPGAVIGIGIVALIIRINPEWIYSGIIALIFGYSTRFFAVGYGTIESGFKKIPGQLDDAASSLGRRSFGRLTQIHLPILRPVLIGAFIMVFVDVAKELPLTLILRPFNFETLATNAFQYAKDEMAPKSASSSLLIIFVSSIPVYFLNKLIK
ncbi:MAG: iron ABC transporter permease [Cyclobacteriaceae bacterium]